MNNLNESIARVKLFASNLDSEIARNQIFDIIEFVEENLSPDRKFKKGDRVTKIEGSKWTGNVVGFYSTKLTPLGYAVESENEQGSVQIYPESALMKTMTQ